MKARQFAKVYQDGEEEVVWVGKVVGGNVTVSAINYHEPQGEGDAHYVTILYSDGTSRRVFRPDCIDFD